MTICFCSMWMQPPVARSFNIRDTISREAPTRSAMSCCGSLLSITRRSPCGVAMPSRVFATRPETSSSARLFTLSVRARTRCVRSLMRLTAMLGFLASTSLKTSFDSTQKLLRSKVITEAERAEIFSRALLVEHDLLALLVGEIHLHLAFLDLVKRIAVIALVDEDGVLGITAYHGVTGELGDLGLVQTGKEGNVF